MIMAIANPRIHVICGICGCKDEFSFHFSNYMRDEEDEFIIDENGDMIPDVYISCGNCASLTGLDELMPLKNENNRLL